MIPPQLGHRAWGSIAPLVLTHLDALRAHRADLIAKRDRLAQRCDTRGVRSTEDALRRVTTAMLRIEAAQ
jgi:hypothetical protein